MELFAGRARINGNGQADPNGVPFDASFDNFLDSFKTVFVLLTNDNWAYVF
jgi:hypothetical protein